MDLDYVEGGLGLTLTFELGKRCVQEINSGHLRYAYVGGSVGRGDADEFSDVDITICLDEPNHLLARNLIYEGEIVQIDTIAPIWLFATSDATSQN